MLYTCRLSHIFLTFSIFLSIIPKSFLYDKERAKVMTLTTITTSNYFNS